MDEAEIIVFEDAAAWESWLADHHDLQAGVWLKLAKKSSGLPAIAEWDVVEIGLCYGWISGQRKGFDERYYLQKYTPRRRRSVWSQVNVDLVAKLIAEGRMREPGMAEVRAAQADGRWDAAYESQANATVPDDLAAALVSDERAGEAFAALNKTQRYAVILPLLKARTPQKRAELVAQSIAALAAEQ